MELRAILEDQLSRGIAYSFAHQRLVLLYARMGRLEDARRHWKIFSETFTNPDPEVAHLVEEAREALLNAERERGYLPGRPAVVPASVFGRSDSPPPCLPHHRGDFVAAVVDRRPNLLVGVGLEQPEREPRYQVGLEPARHRLTHAR